jgi:hypothetical protein
MRKIFYLFLGYHFPSVLSIYNPVIQITAILTNIIKIKHRNEETVMILRLEMKMKQRKSLG